MTGVVGNLQRAQLERQDRQQIRSSFSLQICHPHEFWCEHLVVELLANDVRQILQHILSPILFVRTGGCVPMSCNIAAAAA